MKSSKKETMKSSKKVLSVAFLSIAAMIAASCGETPAQSSTAPEASSSEVVSSSAEASSSEVISSTVPSSTYTLPEGEPEETEPEFSHSTKFNIYFDTELTTSNSNGSLELALDGRYLAWQHIAVPDGTYTLEVKSGNVHIENHVIVGDDYGDFVVTVRAVSSAGKKTAKAIAGKVVSQDKVLFNELWDEMVETNNFTANSPLHGTSMHGDGYYEFYMGTSTSTGHDTYMGGATVNDKWYQYYRDDVTNEIEFDSGYGMSDSKVGMGGIEDIASTSWSEQFDTAGNSYGFYLADAVNQYEESTVVEPLLESLFSSLMEDWGDVMDAGATGLLAALDNDGNIVISPVDDNMAEITKVVYDDAYVSPKITISDVNLTTEDAIETWLQSPVLPEAVDATELTSAFNDLDAAKNYTIDCYGGWYDANYDATTLPSAYSSYNAYFPTFESYTQVTETSVTNVVFDSYSGTFNFIGDDYAGLVDGWTVPSAGQTETYYVKDGAIYYASGTYSETGEGEEAVGSIAYGTPKAVTDGTTTYTSLHGLGGYDEESSKWSVGFVPEGMSAFTPLLSISGSASSESADYYYVNANGDDWDYNNDKAFIVVAWTDGSVIGGLPAYLYYSMTDGIAFNVQSIMNYMYPAWLNAYYISYTIAITSYGISVMEFLPFTSSLTYIIETDIHNIGSTTMDDDTAALVNPSEEVTE